MKKTYATSIITDIRNFTGIFKKFQQEESVVFLEFLESYYKIQYDIANSISNNIHMGSTGDGVLTIFLSENNFLEGYAFLLLVHRRLNKLCKEFTEKTSVKISFGIGADSGDIWDVGKNLDANLDTYVGTVINRTSRIESNTKLFGNTKASIGYYLYNKLLEKLYPSAFSIMKGSKNYDSLLIKYPEVVMISKELMLFYIFEVELKNIDDPVAIFRLSEYMASDDETFWRVITKLIPKETLEILKEI